MRLHEHIVASVVVSSGIYAATNSKTIALVSFCTGILLDLDHVTDYWVQHPLSFSIPHFFEIVESCKLNRNYIWFHSLELLVPLVIITVITRSAVLLAISIGFAQHMLFDSIFNYIYPTSYFLYYRWSKKFMSEHVFDHPDRSSKKGTK